MKKYTHKKLIRDKLPEIIVATGNQYEARVMGKKEFEKELKKKLAEEAKELQQTPKKKLAKELADVLEILKSIAKHYQINFKSIEKKQLQRRKERGGFKKRLFLIWSTKPTS